MRGAASATQLVLIAIIVVLIGVAVWWFLGRSANAPTGPAAGIPAATVPSAAETVVTPTTAAVEDLSIGELNKQARAAMTEGRMVSPPGNNALEFYLRILAKQPDDPDVVDALRELFPFATGPAEDQINQGNFDEASRIISLLTKADPSNYTLTILRSKLDAKKKQNDRDQQLQAQQAAAAAAHAQTTTATATPAGAPAAPGTDSAAAASSSTPAAAPASTAASRTTEVARATPPPSAAPPAAVEPVGETRDARVSTPPRPAYPALAARNRQEGWVEVEFTIAADGSVQNAHVVGANPSRVFDREAVRAIEEAKFEPRLDKGQPVAATLRRRIEFKLGN